MVEQKAVAGEEIVSFAIIDGCVIREHFGAGVRRAWMKRRRFALRCFDNLAKHLRRGRLVKLWRDAYFPDRFEDTHGAECSYVSGVLGCVEADADVRLCG